MHTVYKLVKVPRSGNSHNLCRAETWSIKQDRVFEVLEEAEAYVIKQNFHFCSYDLYLSTGSLTETVIRERCLTDDKYMSRRLYFLGKPSVKILEEQLKTEGILVEHN